MCSQLLNYSSLIIYYHLIFSLLFFHNGPSSKRTQLPELWGPYTAAYKQSSSIAYYSGTGLSGNETSPAHHLLLSCLLIILNLPGPFQFQQEQFYGRVIKVEEK